MPTPNGITINEAGTVVNGVEHLPGVGNSGSEVINGGTPVNRMVTIEDVTNGQQAAFFLTNGSVTEVADPGTNFGTTSDSGNNHDVVWDSTNSRHQIENASGGTVD